MRGDDAVAWVALKDLPADILAQAEVRFVGALEPEYLVELPVGVKTVIVDAVVGVPPGEVLELDLAEMSGRAAAVVTTSSHQLALDRVVALAQLRGDGPLEGRFVGLGIGSVAIGDEPTATVAESIPSLRDAAAGAITRLLDSFGSGA